MGRHFWRVIVTIFSWALLSGYFATNCQMVSDTGAEVGGDDDNNGFHNDLMETNSPLNYKRSWNNLQASWGKRTADIGSAAHYSNGNGHIFNPEYYPQSAIIDFINEDEHDRLVPILSPKSAVDDDSLADYINQEKRAWKSINKAWGKRIGSDWNKFRGSWGKREPGWANLKGLWGKRNNWNKLSSAWGKRDSFSNIDNNN